MKEIVIVVSQGEVDEVFLDPTQELIEDLVESNGGGVFKYSLVKEYRKKADHEVEEL